MRYNLRMKHLITATIILLMSPALVFGQESAASTDDMMSTTTEDVLETESSTSTEAMVDDSETATTTDEVTVSTEEVPEDPELTEEEKDNLFEELKRILFTALSVQLTQVSAIEEVECPVLSRNLYIGDTGLEVTTLQVFLKNLGTTIYPEGQVTGKYGSLTKRAVERFQIRTGIFGPGQVGYGVTGPVTRKTIAEYCDVKAVGTVNTDVAQTSPPAVITPVSSPSSEVTISSSISGDSQIQNSALFNPNSSSVFLQYLNPSEIQATQPVTVGTSTLSTVLTPPSPRSKTLAFTSTPQEVVLGTPYTVSFSESGFSGFDLVSLEGYKDDKQYFFGSTVPALGTYQITVPAVFTDKESFTLVVKHNGDIKDSRTITIVDAPEAITE